ncbi:hypothetical protein DWX41_21890 [Hungatella hathewayi]|uniref:Uncharacterized protein n=2 Tax=Lachnospiraceae TaxID=186803 RepID=A0A174NF21_9FIRM|nr:MULTISPECIES: hypothetical protein [Clostridia]MRM91380.1 hypothetical protein [Faecalicatena contorta]RGC23825.1 hypothetical protein DWX41_21890 [Hungatella hathewayi]CUP45110.1 Uncharacterised protein [[Eubacterium] contortum] [Faecalicatena contorta]
MNHKKAKRKADDVRRKDMKHMAEDAPDNKATKWFRRPAYQAGKMVQEQGEQMEKERETVVEYVARVCKEKENDASAGK